MNVNWFFIIADSNIFTGSCIFRHYNGREQFLYLTFHFISIEIAYNDYSLKIRTIPFLVVFPDCLRLKVHHDLHLANWHLLILIFLEYLRKDGFVKTIRSIITRTPFLIDDASFSLYFIFFKKDSVTPVTNHEKHTVHQWLVGSNYIIDVVDGLIKACVGIDVSTKADTLALEIIKHIFARIVGYTIEGHMLKEVGKTKLVLCFKSTADFLRNVEIGAILGLFVVKNVIGQAIWKHSCLDFRLKRQRSYLHLLRKGTHKY